MGTPAPSSTRKTHVMQLTAGLGIGGAEMVVRDLATAADSTRFHVSICCLKNLGQLGQELERQGADIFTLPGVDYDRADYFTSRRLHALIRARGVDVVHSHTTHALLDSGLCRRSFAGARALHTFHFGNYPHKKTSELWMERVGSRLVDCRVAVGAVQRGQIAAALGLREDAIDVVRNGVAVPVPDERVAAFRAQTAAADQVLVGTLATLIPQKGLADLLRVARQVRDRRSDVHFVVVGEGVLRPELERLRAELGLESAVTFAGWIADAARGALPAFDVYLQPSLWEAMSISILEAMGAAKPVVTTKVGEASHIIEPGVSGYLFAPGDVAGMASAVLDLAAHSDTRRRVGAAAERTVADHHTVGHMVRAYETIYDELGRRSARQ